VATSERVRNCNWKLQKFLTRKIKKHAGFGVRNKGEREAAEKIQGAANKIAKEAANKAAVEEFAASQAARKASRAAKKGRAAEALAACKAGSDVPAEVLENKKEFSRNKPLKAANPKQLLEKWSRDASANS